MIRGSRLNARVNSPVAPIKPIPSSPSVTGREARTDRFVLGSMEFVAPERYGARHATVAVDIYALGVTWYQLLTARTLVLPRDRVRHDVERDRALALAPMEGLPEGAAVEIRAMLVEMSGPGLPRYIDGSRTLKGDGNFPYIAERRGVIFIERSLKQGLQLAPSRAASRPRPSSWTSPTRSTRPR